MLVFTTNNNDILEPSQYHTKTFFEHNAGSLTGRKRAHYLDIQKQ
jgi:hypothetical protein